MKNLFVVRGKGLYKSHQAKIPTRSGKFYLSVVAGNNLYSMPSHFVDDASYTEVEVAIFTIDGEWATKEQASPVFPIIGEGEYAYFDDGNAVFGYVPVEDVMKCVELL